MTPIDELASGVQEASEYLEPVDLEKTPNVGNKKLPRPPLTREQQALAIHYLPFARRLAKSFKAACAGNQDDFESAACLGLIEAAQSYDVSKRIKFATYARIRILGELRDAMREMQLSGWQDDPDNAPQVRHLGHEAERFGRVLFAVADPPVEEVVEARDTVERWMGKLPKAHAATCRLVYLEGMTQAQTAAALGRSRSRVQRLHQQSLVMLNDSFYWKNLTAHEDDLIKPPWTRRKHAEPGKPESHDTPSGDMCTPETVEP